jgi:hypothetical protein
MPKPAALTTTVALLVVAALAGTIVVVHYQYERYTAVYREGSPSAKKLHQHHDSKGLTDKEKTGKHKGEGALVELSLMIDESGQAILQVGERIFGSIENSSGLKTLDYDSVEDFLVRRKKEFKPTKDVPTFRVLVRQGRGVDFKHVLAVLKVCENAGLTNIRFEAAPDPIAEEIERLEREKEAPKQK